jgi:DNA-binding MarR family transcriptional regulator
MKGSATPSGDAVTDLVLEVFRLNGRLLTAGDRLVAPIGLTSARWQVLGAAAFAGGPATVAQLARAMGLARQSVQRIVNELEVEGVLQREENPQHKRAMLVMLTQRGKQLVAAANKRQRPWARALARKLEAAEIERATRVLRALRGLVEIAEGPAS